MTKFRTELQKRKNDEATLLRLVIAIPSVPIHCLEKDTNALLANSRVPIKEGNRVAGLSDPLTEKIVSINNQVAEWDRLLEPANIYPPGNFGPIKKL